VTVNIRFFAVLRSGYRDYSKGLLSYHKFDKKM